MRPSDVTVSERTIQLRKDGPDKLRAKRAPSGRPLLSANELRADVKYRTPMDDSGHLWMEGTRFFECGRYVEYPWYYVEGWDHILGQRYVQVDERKGNVCALCKAARKKVADGRAWQDELQRAAKKHGVRQKRPALAKPRDSEQPPAYVAWIGQKVRTLYVPE